DRYDTILMKPITNRSGNAPAGQYGANAIRYNRLDEVALSSNKVHFWERMEFGAKRRPTGDDKVGTIDRPPQWNNPNAKPRVATFDGAVRVANMSKITALALDQSAASGPSQDIFYPTGDWDPTAGFLSFCGYIAGGQDSAGDNQELECN